MVGLETAKRMYLTTYAPSGRSGTVPTWFMVMDGALYFTTLRASLKARRIQATAITTPSNSPMLKILCSLPRGDAASSLGRPSNRRAARMKSKPCFSIFDCRLCPRPTQSA